MKNSILVIFVLFFVNSFSQSIDYSNFLGKGSKSKIFKIYEFSNLYDYKLNLKDSILIKEINSVTPEAIISKKFINQFKRNQDSLIVFKLRFISKLKLKLNKKYHLLINYMISDNPKILVDDFVLNEFSQWVFNNKPSNEIDYLKTIFQNCNANMLFQFYNSEDDSKYDDLNRLKPLIKNQSGIIDIRKLAKVVKNNKSVLKKYLD